MRKCLLLSVLLINAFQVKAQLSSNALYFDGMGDLVRIPNIPAYNFGFNPFTVEAWVRDDDPAGTMFTNLPILSHRTGTQHPDGFLLTIYEGHLTVIHGSGAGLWIGAVDFRDNICHHVAMTRPTPFSIQCYIDGIYVGSGTLDTVGFTSDFFIGNSPDFMGTPESFHGLIKEVRLWNTARTQSQIQANMNTVLSGAVNQNLVGYWRCNDVGSQIITDYSSQQNHATLGLSTNVESIDPAPAAGCPSCTLPSGSITAGGSLTFCSGSSITLSATAGSGLTYQWKKDGVNVSGATQSIYTANASGNYLCVIANSCGSIASNVLTATVQTVPSITISSNSTVVCTGGYVYISSNATAGSSYQWKLNAAAIAGATSPSYYATSIGNYTCVASNVCGNMVSNTITVTTGTPPPATITSAGATTFCNGKSVVINANTGTNYSFSWLRDGNYISGSGSSYTATQTGNYQAKVSIAYSGCSTISSGIQVTVTPSTTPANLTPPGPIVNCGGSNVVFNANTGTGLTYVWHNYQYFIPFATSSTYTATSNGSYSLSITNSSGCVSVSDTTLVTFTAPAPISINGSTSACAGHGVSLNLGFVELGLTYQWKLNGSNITGATNGNYYATVSGSYTNVVTNACGSFTSPAKVVTINPLPSATITSSGPTTFCSGGSVVLNATVAANRGYQWKKGANLIPGATLSSYTATTGGNYRVIVINTATGCSKTTASATVVTVNSLPAASITAQGPTTFCAGDSVQLKANFNSNYIYQWKRNNTNISGGNTNKYEAKTVGNYKVKVTNVHGCTKLSNTLSVTVPCRDGDEIVRGVNAFQVAVFPNPSSGEFNFEISDSGNENSILTVYDVTGRIVLSENKTGNKFTITNNKLVAGIFTAMVISHQQMKMVRLIKLK